MQSIATLYIVQTSFSRLNEVIHELEDLLQKNDAIIWLEDSVFALYQANIGNILQYPFYILSTDAHLIPKGLGNNINVIDYQDFAKMIQLADKIHTWK